MIVAHQKRMEEIERQKKDMLENNIQKAASEYQKKHENDKNYKGFFTQGLEKNVSLTQNQIRQLNAMYDKEVADYSRMIMERQNKDDEYRLQYLEKYGYMYEQRAAIAEKYDKKIAKATNEWQKKSLEEEKKEALSSFALKQFQENINWDALLGDISRYTKKALKEVQKQIRAFMRTAEYKAMKPTDKQIIIQGLQKIDNATTVGIPFREFSQSIRELRDAQIDYDNKKNESDIIGNNQSLPDEIRQIALKREQEASERLKIAKDNAAKSGDILIDRLTLLTSSFAKLGSSANLSLSEIGNSVLTVLSGLGALSGDISGIIGAVISIMDIISKQGLDGFIKNLGSSILNYEKELVKWSPSGLLAQAFGVKFDANNSSWKAADSKYRELSSVWDDLINKKREYLNMSWGVEAENASQEILDLIEAETKAAQIAAIERVDAGSSAGSHSYGYRMWKGSYSSSAEDNKGKQNPGTNKSNINWRDVNVAVVQGLKEAGLGDVKFDDMKDLVNMTSDQLTWIKTNYAGLWSKMDTTFKGYLEDLITYGEYAQDTIQALKEQLVGTSFDTVFDDALSSLKRYADGAEDVFDEIGQNWQKMINNMVVNNVIGNKLRENLEKWYDELHDSYTDDNKLDTGEIEKLKKEYDDIINTAKTEIDALKKAGIIKDVEEDSQSATAKAVSNITYDQANVIDGRLTAIQICSEHQLEEMLVQSKYQERISTTLDDILRPTREIDNNIEIMLGIQSSMNEHLEAISENTKCLPSMASDISKMKKKIESM